ncbi:hypothetical protein [Nitrosomonas sp.]|uniref:hypothetical protein n=1 Tax=Nitrosomonas sp. TaxID=42353 RepID=UPI0025EAEB2A|nr:hypothetical protein [Nitrosomonas sp.]
MHDSNTLPEILRYVEISREKAAKQAVYDRDYRGKVEVNGTQIIERFLKVNAVPLANSYNICRKIKCMIFCEIYVLRQNETI